MMTEGEIVAAVVEWAEATVEEVAGNAYPYMAAAKVKGLPDVMVTIARSYVANGDPDFALIDVQQAYVRIREIVLSFMVGVADLEADHEAADAQLRTMADRLIESLLVDHTLGHRVPLAAPNIEVDYEPAFIEYADGTRGRTITVLLSVGEPLIYQD